MKKLSALVVISMFALAACQPMNLTASGEDIDAAVASLNESSNEINDVSSENMGSDDSNTSESEGSESSDGYEMESSSSSGEIYTEDSSSQYTVDILLENEIIIPEELILHEGSNITWTNNNTVTYTITITKIDNSSDDSMDDSSDDSYDDDSMDDSNYVTKLTVEPGQTISFTLRDSGTYKFTITGGTVSLSGTIYVSDSESDDSYDDEMNDSYDDSADDDWNDDSYNDSSDDSYDDDSDDSYGDNSDDSYDDSDEYDDDEEDSEDEEDDHSYLFIAFA